MMEMMTLKEKKKGTARPWQNPLMERDSQVPFLDGLQEAKRILLQEQEGETSRLFRESVEAQEEKVEMKRDCPKPRKHLNTTGRGVWNRCHR
jgi:hypothetical protein